jgi:hypothetical protein
MDIGVGKFSDLGFCLYYGGYRGKSLPIGSFGGISSICENFEDSIFVLLVVLWDFYLPYHSSIDLNKPDLYQTYQD